MTHSPENGSGATGGLSPEQQELLASMRDRSVRMQELMAAIAAEMGGMAVDLNRLIDGDSARPTTSTPSVAATTSAELFIPFSAVEQALKRPQEQLEAISAKDRELPLRIQEIFMPSLTFFDAELQTRANPTTDPRVKLITITTSSGLKRQVLPYRRPRQIPGTDEPKKREKALRRHTHRHEWTQQDAERHFVHSYSADYVPLADDTRQLVGYTVGRRIGTGAFYIRADEKYCTQVHIKVGVSDGLVQKAELTLTEPMDATKLIRTEYTSHDFTTGDIHVEEAGGGHYARRTVRKLAYNADEYRYDGSDITMGADEVLASLRSYVAAVSGK